MSVSPKRILFFPLSNVLGHLTRTFALAEEFDAQGHDVFIAVDGSYPQLTRALPPRIRVVRTPEFDAHATRCFGPIVHYEEGLASDRANLESANRLDRSELRRRGERLAEMVKRDAAIVDELRPDAIITDYRFTMALLPQARERPVFHISHLLGYPSLYRRVMGEHFFPLVSGRILVPGVARIERWRRGAPSSRRDEIMCGPFRWRGWERLQESAHEPPSSSVFLCFGSTGKAEQIVPWLLQNIPQRYRVSAIAARPCEAGARPGAHLVEGGDLGRFLAKTQVAFCHGGHGTVMECILHCTPMAIFPQNLEQLEIGRCIEALGLGVVVKQPYDRLSGEQLGALVEALSTDARMAQNLGQYATLLRRHAGPKRALSAVLHRIARAERRTARDRSVRARIDEASHERDPTRRFVVDQEQERVIQDHGNGQRADAS